MNLKTVLMALAMGGLAVAGVGCGNACDDYADAATAKFEECAVDTPADGGGETGDCTDELATLAECLTPCLEAVSCEGLKGEDLDNLTTYSECSGECITGGGGGGA